MRHAITVDVEDWYQSTYDAKAELSDRFLPSTRKVLDAFQQAGIKATFFVLGLAVRKSPAVVREIMAAGHEVQSHGYGHVEVFELTEEQFRQDLLRAKKMIEDLSGAEVIGYRAPSFSIDERTPWALDVLAETGHQYDSSIFPIKTSRYGVEGYRPEPHIVTTSRGQRIVEAPLACFDFLGKRRPCGGGGYFRLYPYWLIRRAFCQLDRMGRAGVVYLHPYEYDPEELDSYKSVTTWKQRLHQGLGRRAFAGKVDRLIRDVKVGPLREVLAHLLAELPTGRRAGNPHPAKEER